MKKEEKNMTYLLHGGMEGVKIEMKCGLVFRPNKKSGLKFLKSDLGLNRGRTTIMFVRTRFDLNPKREWIQAHVAQTMNL